jgi:hypothetical protein
MSLYNIYFYNIYLNNFSHFYQASSSYLFCTGFVNHLFYISYRDYKKIRDLPGQILRREMYVFALKSIFSEIQFVVGSSVCLCLKSSRNCSECLLFEFNQPLGLYVYTATLSTKLKYVRARETTHFTKWYSQYQGSIQESADLFQVKRTTVEIVSQYYVYNFLPLN